MRPLTHKSFLQYANLAKTWLALILKLNLKNEQKNNIKNNITISTKHEVLYIALDYL